MIDQEVMVKIGKIIQKREKILLAMKEETTTIVLETRKIILTKRKITELMMKGMIIMILETEETIQ